MENDFSSGIEDPLQTAKEQSKVESFQMDICPVTLEDGAKNHTLTRRDFIRLGITGAAALAVSSLPARVQAQAPVIPAIPDASTERKTYLSFIASSEKVTELDPLATFKAGVRSIYRNPFDESDNSHEHINVSVQLKSGDEEPRDYNPEVDTSDEVIRSTNNLGEVVGLSLDLIEDIKRIALAAGLNRESLAQYRPKDIRFIIDDKLGRPYAGSYVNDDGELVRLDIGVASHSLDPNARSMLAELYHWVFPLVTLGNNRFDRSNPNSMKSVRAYTEAGSNIFDPYCRVDSPKNYSEPQKNNENLGNPALMSLAYSNLPVRIISGAYDIIHEHSAHKLFGIYARNIDLLNRDKFPDVKALLRDPISRQRLATLCVMGRLVNCASFGTYAYSDRDDNNVALMAFVDWLQDVEFKNLYDELIAKGWVYDASEAEKEKLKEGVVMVDASAKEYSVDESERRISLAMLKIIGIKLNQSQATGLGRLESRFLENSTIHNYDYRVYAEFTKQDGSVYEVDITNHYDTSITIIDPEANVGWNLVVPYNINDGRVAKVRLALNLKNPFTGAMNVIQNKINLH